MVRESRIVADLMISEASKEEWEQAIVTDNRLQKRTPATARRLAQSIRKRLERMTIEFWQAIRDGDEELSTQAAFCSALARNLLLVEFMEKVVTDAYITHAETLELYQWNDFLDECAERDAAIHDWTQSSKKKMGQVALRMLAEMGYLEDTRSMKLQNVVIRPEIRMMLSENYKQRLLKCMEIGQQKTQLRSTP